MGRAHAARRRRAARSRDPLAEAQLAGDAARLPAILTHEMSHAHIQGWISPYAYVRLPNWFKEGLAVAVSGGGGAEFVTETEARAAIERGEHIAIDDTGSLTNLSEVQFVQAPAAASASHRTVLAYRQAGVCCLDYLCDVDAQGFGRMLNAILDGKLVCAGRGRRLPPRRAFPLATVRKYHGGAMITVRLSNGALGHELRSD